MNHIAFEAKQRNVYEHRWQDEQRACRKLTGSWEVSIRSVEVIE